MAVIARKDTKIAYVFMPKVASSSLSQTFFESEEKRQEATARPQPFDLYSLIALSAGLNDEHLPDAKKYAKQMQFAFVSDIRTNWRRKYDFSYRVACFDENMKLGRMPLTKETFKDYFIFTFVRNPFYRLTSCFQSKFKYDDKIKKYVATGAGIGFRVNIRAKPRLVVKGFNDFIYQIGKVPHHQLDEHVRFQKDIVGEYGALGCKLNFIGKFEKLTEQFEPIRKKYNLLPLENKGSSNYKALHTNWQDYYTPALAQSVYELYRQDFKAFGYEEEYPKLLEYIKQNHPEKWRKHPTKRNFFAKLGLVR